MGEAEPGKQAIQEAEYDFPYHYLDLRCDRHKYIAFVPMMSRYRLVRDRLGDVRGLTILDAGCGDGRFCYEWRHSGAELVGVDFSERAIAFARAFVPEAEFHCGAVAAIERDGEFDWVVLIETLEHVPPDEISGFLAKLANALKADGKMVVTVPSTLRPLDKKHYQHFDEASLRAALSGSFDVIEVSGSEVAPDLRLRIRKLLAKAAFSARRGKGWLARLTTGYPDWYFRNYYEGAPSECRGLIATCVLRRPATSADFPHSSAHSSP